MKLKNKLLPIIGTAAIVATATPLALTSCGSTFTTVDLTNGYKPTVAQHEKDYLGQNNTNKEYLNNIQSNNEIFKQDFLWGTYNRFNNLFNRTYSGDYSSAIFKLKSLKAGFSTPSFKMVNISYPGEPDVQYPTITLDMQYDFEISVEYMTQKVGYTSASAYQGIEIKGSMSVGYKDVPFFATQLTYGKSKGTYEGYWNASIPTFGEEATYDQAWIYEWNSNPWAIAYNLTGTMETTNVVVGEDTEWKTIDLSQSGTIQTVQQMRDFMYATVSGTDYYEASNVLFNSGYNKSGYVAPATLDYWCYWDDYNSEYVWRSIDCFKAFLPVELASLSYASYYLNNIIQYPEMYSRGNAAFADYKSPVTTTTDFIIGKRSSKTSYQYPLAMPYSTFVLYDNLTVPVKYYVWADVDSEGKPTADNIVFEGEAEDGTTNTLTITCDGSQNQINTMMASNDYTVAYFALPAAHITTVPTSTTTYTFKLPKYIVVKPVIEGAEVDIFEPQKVYLNQETIDLTVTI